MSPDLSTLPFGILIVLSVVLLVEIALDVVAIVDLIRRPVAAVQFGNKWVWVAIIVLINLIGAILYFAVGRKQTPVVDADARTAAPRRSSAEITDALYGTGDESTQP
jgi:hypothetical protein